MALSPSFVQWDLKTQKLCIENMRWVSRPINWAVREINFRHYPHSKIYPLIIQLLRRLNLPLIYLTSEVTVIVCIASALWQIAAKIFKRLTNRSIKFDSNTLLMAFQLGQMAKIVAWRRIELIFEIIHQILFGPVPIKMQKHWKDRRPWTPPQPIASHCGQDQAEKTGCMPQSKELRARNLLHEINRLASEKSAALSPHQIAPSTSSLRSKPLDDSTPRIKFQKSSDCKTDIFKIALYNEKTSKSLNQNIILQQSIASVSSVETADGPKSALDVQFDRRALSLIEPKQTQWRSSHVALPSQSIGRKIDHVPQALSSTPKPIQARVELIGRRVDALASVEKDLFEVATPERLDERSNLFTRSPVVKFCALNPIQSSRHHKLSRLKKRG